MIPFNLKKRAVICKIQIFAQKFMAYPILSRQGVRVVDENGIVSYINEKPKTDWNVELYKTEL